MIHFTKSQIKKIHYIPANNMFADWIIGGEKACLETLKEKEARFAKNTEDAAGFCAICTKSYMEWYKRSCLLVIKDLKEGKPINENYPPWDDCPCPDMED